MTFLRHFGKITEQPNKKNGAYYGIACTRIINILSLQDYTIKFTPNSHNGMINYFHTDIFDNFNSSNLPDGTADSASNNLRKDKFLQIWTPFPDNGTITKKEIH